MKLKYAIQINASPYASDSSWIAYQFVQTVLTLNHQIYRIFFYQEGIYHAFRYAQPPENEFSLTEQWSALAKSHDIDLVVCISAAQKRGLLSIEEAQRQQKVDQDLAEGFRISGLSQWVEAILIADRFLIFG
ncbi:MAG: sulfurtransferase complex subunit TusD [Pseudomonadota bacterium]|jgi:tRNA 2-thiouridine synthesizing protein D